jgi:chromosome segregation ATPase
MGTFSLPGRLKEELDYTLADLQEDYNQCVRTIRKTYNYLEQVGVREFNKYSKYKWSLDRDRGCSYVCIRYGSSLGRKSLVKSSAYLEDAELYKWIENKDLICEALDEACRYIRDKVLNLKRKMDETKLSIMEYEEKLRNLGEELEEAEPAITRTGAKVMG